MPTTTQPCGTVLALAQPVSPATTPATNSPATNPERQPPGPASSDSRPLKAPLTPATRP